MKEIAHDTLLKINGVSVFDTIVRYLKPPRNAEEGWTQSLVCGATSTWRTPSYVVLASGKEESSDAVGRMKEGDSVNERENFAWDETLLRFSEIRPPTYRIHGFELALRFDLKTAYLASEVQRNP